MTTLVVVDPGPLAAPHLMRQATALLDAGTAHLQIELAAQAPREVSSCP